MRSETASIVIQKDLRGAPAKAGEQRRPEIRRATIADLLSLLHTDSQGELDANDSWERRLRRHIVDTIGVDGCYVADVADSRPAFMQFLFTADDNARLHSSLPGLFPILAAEVALVEFLYISPEARNPGFAINSLVQVTEEARRRGATSVISFIDPDNKGALFMNHLAGFSAQSVRRRKKRLFRSTFTFEDWPAGVSQALNDVASGKVTIS
jgi:GNAT superfamily N-acetyltransferase